MLDMGLLGWIVVGFLAGAFSGAVVGDRTARGCLPNIIVGVLGGILGGWLAVQLGYGQTNGFIAAVFVAFVGAVIVRLILRAVDPHSGRW
jgi:uncharacterized membrane protein YeaQ/YmgE (transglycosylase-associated protein family)